MLWDLPVFALIGLLAGAAARMFYPGRQPMRILGTVALGTVGGLIGGMISWACWPEVDGQFQSGNLVMSIFGAVLVIAAWAGVSYGAENRRARLIPFPDASQPSPRMRSPYPRTFIMTSPQGPGSLRRLWATLGGVLQRRIPGKPSHDYMKEYEPVHGWTRRQLVWYLTRNPGYRSTYEAAVRGCSRGPRS
jgi:uncharacterized membrane protein YeaQ/YmgE (transglycosylase-associated protein family)